METGMLTREMDGTARIVDIPRDVAWQSPRLLWKRFLLGTVGAAFAGVTVWFSGYWWTTSRFIESTDDA